ncbi:MAG: Beta-galactosidase/beta-glucuronidase, partial [Pedosphaera sp.]|nr:Beta-galactosidase/beta-glucuronidase [Pedosphaera sp.]
GYGNGPKSLDEFYSRYQGLVDAQLDNPNLFGFCYTQLTDVEQERNGLYYYDRKPKFDVKRLHDITARAAAYEKTGPTAPAPAARPGSNWQLLVGAAADGKLSKPWRYTTVNPTGDWNGERSDDQGWQTAMAPFGAGLSGVRTAWTNSDIWLRQTFDWESKDFRAAALVIFHDEDTEVYVNGRKVWSHEGFASAYEMFPVTDTLKAALRQGSNTIAVHTHQTAGGQFIDLALLVDSSTVRNHVEAKR